MSELPENAVPILSADFLESLAQRPAQASVWPVDGAVAADGREDRMETSPIPTTSSDLSESDIYNMSDFPAAQEVKKQFVLDGKVKTITFSTAALTDAEAFMELATVLELKRDTQGRPLPTELRILPPNGPPFLLKNTLYIAELKLLSKVCPALSLTAWAVLGKKIGPKGKAIGEHGVQDIVEYAMQVNGLTAKASEQDAASAEKDGAADTLPTA